MAVTITGQDNVVFTFNDEEIRAISVDIVASVEQYGQYTGGPADAYLYESDGPVAAIVIRGTLLTAATTRTSSGVTTTIDQQRQWLAKQINGSQIPKAFTSNYAATMYSNLTSGFVPTKIITGRFSYGEEEGLVSEVPFTLSLLVGTQ